MKQEIDALKVQAQVEFKNGSYSQAIALYQQAEQLLVAARNGDFETGIEKLLA